MNDSNDNRPKALGDTTPASEVSERKENYEETYEVVQPEQIIDQTALIASKAFVGDYPIETIMTSIAGQFQDYLNTDDRHNYVDSFYTQLTESYRQIYDDVGSENPQERNDALNSIYDKFINEMVHLIDVRLGLSINGLDEDHLQPEELQFVLTRIYEYFILRARNNFKVAIASSVNATLSLMTGLTDEDYFPQIQELLESFNPLITSITPLEFLAFTGDREMLELFNSHRVVGNFLSRYTPKLYQNELFVVELVNYITARRELGQDFHLFSQPNGDQTVTGRSTILPYFIRIDGDGNHISTGVTLEEVANGEKELGPDWYIAGPNGLVKAEPVKNNDEEDPQDGQ